MLEQHILEGLLARRDQLGSSIAKRKQQLTDLNAEGDGSTTPINLARADSLVCSRILTTRIAQLEQRQLRIDTHIDDELLPMAQEYDVELRTKRRQHHRIQTHREYLQDLTNEDMSRLDGEYAEHTQRPYHDPVLARAIEALKRQEEAKQATPAVSEPIPEQQQLTYTEIEDGIRLVGGRLPSPAQRRLIEAFIPPALPQFRSPEHTRVSSELLQAVKPSSSWDDKGKGLFRTMLGRTRRILAQIKMEIPRATPKGGADHLQGRYFLKGHPIPEATAAPDGAEKKSGTGSNLTS